MNDRLGTGRDGEVDGGRREGTAGGRENGGGANRDGPGEPLSIVRPDWDAPDRVRVLSTTRAGGVSEPPYDSLNLGLHVGDDPVRVRENRRRLAERLSLPSPPVWLAQVHGARVVAVDEPYSVSAVASDAVVSAGAVSDDPVLERIGVAERAFDEAATAAPFAPHEADGAWTERRGIVLAVLTADCLPVVITDAAGARVAVVHAGWRGLVGGVLDSALGAFPAGAALHAWLGPAIGPRAFEVGAEVREAFVARDAAHAGAFVPTGAPGKFLADLYALARGELRRERGDVVNVSGGDRCTLSESAYFHSHRRDGTHSGRMATLAWLS